MSQKEMIIRYSLIINKLRKSPASLQEIQDYLSRESELQDYNFRVSSRTFRRDLDNISSLYNIDIEYDYSQQVYKIKYDEEPEINERMLEAFDIFNVLSISERLSEFIQFENRKHQGTENMYGLLNAIKYSSRVSFLYQKFWQDQPETRYVEPFALKEFKNRWYLIANDLKDNRVKTFGLDRLSELNITTKKQYREEKFNTHDYFKHSFGIIKSDKIGPEDVILKFEAYQGKYIKSLPLHESQSIISDNEEGLIIKLRLNVTYDFIMELLSYGRYVKVIQPSSLIEKIKHIYSLALAQYET